MTIKKTPIIKWQWNFFDTVEHKNRRNFITGNTIDARSVSRPSAIYINQWKSYCSLKLPYLRPSWFYVPDTNLWVFLDSAAVKHFSNTDFTMDGNNSSFHLFIGTNRGNVLYVFADKNHRPYKLMVCKWN